ncbi:MAG: hypothetical protein IIA59_09400 [Candidatus Marinimicrobia bacterium]|nr:hypothetical protein [Candidatus Neomarinimicrobiota bacterium]
MDTDSPYHRKALPNLNGTGRFLRGALDSGVVQEDQMQSHRHLEDVGHSHEYRGARNETGGGLGDGIDLWDGMDKATTRAKVVLGDPTATGAGIPRHGPETRPVNMSVVWIIKIKQLTAAYPTQAYLAEANAPQGALYVSRAGNVGIGTAEPGAKLEVNGTVKATAFQGDGSQLTGISAGKWSDGLGGVIYYNEGHVGIGTDAPTAPLTIKTTSGPEIFFTGGGEGYNADIHSEREFHLGTINSSHLSLMTDNQLRMTINGAGNVGVGTAEPNDKLEVYGDLRINTAAGDNDEIFFTDNGQIRSLDNNHRILFRRSENKMELREYGDLIFSPGATAGMETAKVIMKANGNVGIGTTDPQATAGGLHVAGTTYFGSSYGLNSHFPWTDRNVYITGDNIFFRRGSDASWANRMTINNDGNVGIGTTGPRDVLHLYRQSKSTVGLLMGNSFTGSERRGFLVNYHGSNGAELWNFENTDMWFGTNNNRRMTIKAGGNVGIGTANPGGDKLDVRGRCYASGGWWGTNSDYAEYFESTGATPTPGGTSVFLTRNGKIRPAKKDEIPIGVVSDSPAIVGNSYKEWPKKYLRDEYSQVIMEEYQDEIMAPKKEKVKRERQKVKKKKVEEERTRLEVVKKGKKYVQKEVTEIVVREVEEQVFKEVNLYDKAGKKVIGKHLVPVMETYEEEVDMLDDNREPVMVGTGEFVTKSRPKLNPKYDESKEYVPREDRPEWNCVGLLGQLPLRKGHPVAPTWVKIKDISDKVELWLVK